MLNSRILIDEHNTILQRSYRTPKGNQAFRRYKQVPTPTFFEKVTDKPIVLPQNTRFHRYYGNDINLFVTEYPPQMRTIQIHLNMKLRWQTFLNWCETNNIKDGAKFFKGFGTKAWGEKRFQLLFPYIIMINLISQKGRWVSTYSFLSQKPIVNIRSMLYKIPMYNIQRDQRVCMASALPYEIFKMTLPDAIDKTFKAYFDGSFNSDYRYNLVSYKNRKIFSNYFIWAYLSANDPLKIFKQKLVPYKCVEDVIKDLEARYRIGRSSFSDFVSIF